MGAASLVVAMGMSGCMLDLSHLREGDPEPSPSEEQIDAAPIVEKAVADLAEWPAVKVSGDVTDDIGTARKTTLTVTDTGAVSGTMTDSGSELEVMEVDGKLFLSADDSYWLSKLTVSPDVDSYGSNWVRVTPEDIGIEPSAVLAPAELSKILQSMATGKMNAVEVQVDGSAAYRISLPEGQIWVSKKKPHTLLRMEVPKLVPAEGDAPAPGATLDIQKPTKDTLTTFFDGLEEDAKKLNKARDSNLQPAWDGQIDMNCETGGKCTVTGKVVDQSSGDYEGTTLARMLATFNNDELGKKECSDSGKLEAGGSVELSCGTDYGLAASTDPQSYQIEGNATLSTRALSGDAVDKLVKKLQEDREATLAKAE